MCWRRSARRGRHRCCRRDYTHGYRQRSSSNSACVTVVAALGVPPQNLFRRMVYTVAHYVLTGARTRAADVARRTETAARQMLINQELAVKTQARVVRLMEVVSRPAFYL